MNLSLRRSKCLRFLKNIFLLSVSLTAFLTIVTIVLYIIFPSIIADEQIKFILDKATNVGFLAMMFVGIMMLLRCICEDFRSK